MLRWKKKKHWRNKIQTPGCQPWDRDPPPVADLVFPCQEAPWDGLALNTFSQQPRRDDRMQLHVFPGRIFPVILAQTPSGPGQTSPQRCRGCPAPFQGVRAAAVSLGVLSASTWWPWANGAPSTQDQDGAGRCQGAGISPSCGWWLRSQELCRASETFGPSRGMALGAR